MTTVDKNDLLEKLFNQTEEQLACAVHTFQNLPVETMLRPGENNGWSIAQCMEHLNRYGAYYLPEIKSALVRAKLRRNATIFRSSWLGNYFTLMMDPSTGVKKVKAFKDYVPDRHLDVAAVTAEYIRQLEELTIYLRQAYGTDLAGARVPVSIARVIRLRLGDVLRFVVAHNERHFRQMKRALQPQAQALP